MMNPLDKITVEVQDIERSGTDSVVTVKVTAASDNVFGGVPTVVANMRARGRALMTAGPVPAGVDKVKDITAGDLSRLTEVESEREVGSGNIVEKIYKIRVSG